MYNMNKVKKGHTFAKLQVRIIGLCKKANLMTIEICTILIVATETWKQVYGIACKALT